MTYDVNTIMKFMYKYFNDKITKYIRFTSGNNVKDIVLMKQCVFFIFFLICLQRLRFILLLLFLCVKR